MPQTFTYGPTTARQDAILAAIAAKRGVTVDELVNSQMTRIFQQFRNEFDQDVAVNITAAYQSATPAQQAQIRNILGL